MACLHNTYMDPGSGLCRSCYGVCDENVDPGLERDCKRFCPEMYEQKKEGDSKPLGAAGSVAETAAQTLSPEMIFLIVIVCFVITAVVGIMLFRRYKSSPCIRDFEAPTELVTEAPTSNGHMPHSQTIQEASVPMEERPTRALLVTETPTSNGHMPHSQTIQEASVPMEERPTRATSAASSTASASRTAGSSSQAASRPEDGSRAPLLHPGASSDSNVSRHSDCDEPTQTRGPIANPLDTDGPTDRVFG